MSWLPSQQPNVSAWHGHSYPAATPQLFASAETGAVPARRIAMSAGMPTWSRMAAWKALNGGGPPFHNGGLPPTQHPASRNAARNMADRARIGDLDLGAWAGGSMSHDARPPRPASRQDNQSRKRVSRGLSPRRLPPAVAVRYLYVMRTTEKGSPKLTLAKARQEHARLEADIAEHDRRYYREDQPTISDAAYDELRRRYAALEEAFPQLAGAESLTRKVGAAPSEKFAKVRHAVPMLSLGNIFAEEEVEEF